MRGCIHIRKIAFTLAEVMTVIALLGVVAAITIPSTIKRVKEKANRTKIIKAMAIWEQFVPAFLADNGISTENEAAQVYNNSPDCTIVTKYFNVKKEHNHRGNCVFDTADGLTWEFDSVTI